MSPAEECPSEEALVLYARGETPGTLDAHLEGCAACRAVISTLLDGALSVTNLSELTLKSLEPVRLARGTLVGRHFVLEHLGTGGMGVVYSAFDPTLERPLAIKILRLAANPGEGAEGAGARLLREAQAMARLSHPNVITVYDFGTFEGQIFVAMELIRGPTLGAWLGVQKRSWREVLSLFVDAGRGLAAAHAAGIVHRDFKPDNVLIDPHGHAHVGDFGLARAVEPAATLAPGMIDLRSVVTQAGQLLGTPAYMSPEQLQRQPVDARSDQFSFCLALYEALYGQRPWTGQTLAELWKAMQTQPARPPRGMAGPARLRRIIARGLNVDPSKRFGSMDELVRALTGVLGERRVRLIELAAVTVLAVVTAFVVTRKPTGPCSDQARLAPAWEAPLVSRLASTLLPAGPKSALESASGLLRSYARQWTHDWEQTCAQRQDSAVLLLKMACFEQRRRDLTAVVDGLASASPEQLTNAVVLVSALRPVAGCSTLEDRSAGAVSPPPPALAAQVGQLRSELANQRVRWGLSVEKDPVGAAQRLVGQAAALGYLPLQAEAMLQLARIQIESGQSSGALVTLEKTRQAAEASADDEVRLRSELLEAQIRVLNVVDYERGQICIDRARALLERMGTPVFLELEVANASGAFAFQTSRLQTAAREFGRALELKEQLFGPRNPETASTLVNLGQVRKALGDFEGAEQAEQRAVDAFREALGDSHSKTLTATNALATVRLRRGDASGAAVLFAQSIAAGDFGLAASQTRIREAEAWAMAGDAVKARVALTAGEKWLTEHLSPDDLWTAQLHFARARVAQVEGAKKAAIDWMELALASRKKAMGPDSPQLSQTVLMLSQMKSDAGDWKGARADAETALALAEHLPDAAPIVADCQSWLGQVEVEQADPAALPMLETALKWQLASEPDPLRLALTRVALARALKQVNGDAARIHELVAAAQPLSGNASAAGKRLKASLESLKNP
jgi:tetratricopeptide (TPR) repeat protein